MSDTTTEKTYRIKSSLLMSAVLKRTPAFSDAPLNYLPRCHLQYAAPQLSVKPACTTGSRFSLRGSRARPSWKTTWPETSRDFKLKCLSFLLLLLLLNKSLRIASACAIYADTFLLVSRRLPSCFQRASVKDFSGYCKGDKWCISLLRLNSAFKWTFT